MSTKTFTIAGTSVLNGKEKLRVANGTIKHRTAVLGRSGHTDINLVELPEAMTRAEAIEFLELNTEGTTVVEAPTEVVAETTVEVETADEAETA